jgi:hypothetical protein
MARGDLPCIVVAPAEEREGSAEGELCEPSPQRFPRRRSAFPFVPLFQPLEMPSRQMGTLIGADLTNLDKVAGLGAPVASNGGGRHLRRNFSHRHPCRSTGRPLSAEPAGGAALGLIVQPLGWRCGAGGASAVVARSVWLVGSATGIGGGPLNRARRI